MAINAAALLSFKPEPFRSDYSSRDVILYHLGIGAGVNGVEADLRYVWEHKLEVLPSMATVLGANLQWLRRPEFGIRVDQMVHAEEDVRWLGPIPPEGFAEARTTVEALYDRGPERGALLKIRSDVSCNECPTAIVTMTVLLRGDGGFGGNRPPVLRHEIPERSPDFVVTSATRPEQAMIYRLSGDHYPLHIDPAFARQAGYNRPILHGLATYGYAARHAVEELCGGNGARLQRLSARFSAPVYPGDDIRSEFWRIGCESFVFRCLAGGSTVLSSGRAEIVP